MLCLGTAHAQGINLGVLEDVPGSYAGEKNWPGVRAVFHKDPGGQWTAYPTDCTEPDDCAETAKQFPAGQRWTIGFDGKKVGELSTTVRDDADLGSHIGLQKVTDQSVPWVGRRSNQFAGFLFQPVYRPLVANTQPYVSDPDAWKPEQVSNDISAALRRAFRQKYPKLCVGREEAPAKPLTYKDDAILVRKAYRSRGNWAVASLRLPGAMECDSESASIQMDDPVFIVSPQGEARFLGAGIWLVDAGDYDNDGHSELVFAIDQYNRGGYILYRADFSKSATFAFTYH